MESAPTGRRLTEKDWISHEATIRDLFFKDDLPLRKVKAFMEENHDFHPSDRQWKHRMKRWKLDKNIKDHEMRAMVRKRQHRIISEPHRPRLKFRMRKFKVDPRKVIRWMHENDIAADQLYKGDSGTHTPSDISCYTESRQGSPVPDPGVETRMSTPTSQAESIPQSPVREPDLRLMAPEPTNCVCAGCLANKTSSRSDCWVKKVDMSWAFDKSWSEILTEHSDEQSSLPLTALFEFLRRTASKGTGYSASHETLATVLQGHPIDKHQGRGFSQDGNGKELEWYIRIDRRALNHSTTLIWAHVERETPSNEQLSWLDLRLRTGSGGRYYREGAATYQVVHGSGYSDEIMDALFADDVREVQRILSAGEATVYHIDDHDRYPLAHSIYSGKVQMARLLLEQGSPLYFERWSPETFIWHIWEGFTEDWQFNSKFDFEKRFAQCKALMTLASEHNARLDECIDTRSEIANIMFLINRARYLQSELPQYQQVLQYLIGLGVDLEFCNVDGCTPLLEALTSNPNPALIVAYLSAGADTTASDHKRRGYLDLIISKAIYCGYVDLSKYKEILTSLLRHDRRFKERPITPLEIPLIEECVRVEKAWKFLEEVFQDMHWSFEEMLQYALHQESSDSETEETEPAYDRETLYGQGHLPNDGVQETFNHLDISDWMMMTT